MDLCDLHDLRNFARNIEDVELGEELLDLLDSLHYRTQPKKDKSEKKSHQTTIPACGNPQCGVSTAIDEVTFTFGSGRLDENGFWENPCPICAEAAHKSNPNFYKHVWPKSLEIVELHLLLEHRMHPVHANIKVTDLFDTNFTVVANDKSLIHGEHVAIKGKKEDVYQWLGEHSPVWMGKGLPMLQDFQEVDFREEETQSE